MGWQIRRFVIIYSCFLVSSVELEVAYSYVMFKIKLKRHTKVLITSCAPTLQELGKWSFLTIHFSTWSGQAVFPLSSNFSSSDSHVFSHTYSLHSHLASPICIFFPYSLLQFSFQFTLSSCITCLGQVEKYRLWTMVSPGTF